MKIRLTWRWLCTGLTLCLSAGAFATEDRWSQRSATPLSESLTNMRLNTPISIPQALQGAETQILHPQLQNAAGPQQVIVQLRNDPTARIDDEISGARASHRVQLEMEQADFINRCLNSDPNIRVLGQIQHVLNAVFLEVPAESLAGLAADAEVIRVAPVGRYEVDLSETVPYIGAKAVQKKRRIKGRGVSVAVLDSGIDYTHASLGGSGDPADYIANDGAVIEPGTFPTRKVVGGFDFVGNQWPFGPLLPDPDPLDDLALEPGAFAGHGTHVADIIAGKDGVAPKADLYAVKVCASLSSACSGIALLQGMDFAVDPDGDGDTSDRVDIINMSLGGVYGQPFDDDLALAVDNASAIGTLTVAAAGNCSDKPYCTGTPAAAPTAISVAQTNVPSAEQAFVNVVEPAVVGGTYLATRYSWTPAPGSTVGGLVQYGDLDGTNLDGCAPFTGDLSGMIVAVDRGACFFSDKIRNIENAGGIVGIIMFVAPGAPFDGAFAGGDPINIPGYNVEQTTGDILRSGVAVVEFGPEFTTSLAGVTVSSSARGPEMSFNSIKPEIGAPGASVSAEVATGTENTPFGGTSGASPMVAGAAALLLEDCQRTRRYRGYWHWGYAYGLKYSRWGYGKRRDCSPLKIKSLLVNNGYRDIVSDTTGNLAEITRIGGGEVRVDDAVKSNFWVYSPDDDQPALSLGHVDVTETQTIKRTVEVVNNGKRFQRIKVEPTFRFDDNPEIEGSWWYKAVTSGAMQIKVFPSRVWLPPGGKQKVKVFFTLDPELLAGNPFNSGSNGGNPAALSAAELDGYLVFKGRRGESSAMPWHVMPRKAADVIPEREALAEVQVDSIALANAGAGTAQIDGYSIVALSDQMPRGERGASSPTPDIRAVGVNTALVPPGFCSADSSFVWQFAVNTWERQSHLLPVSHQIGLDIDGDFFFDYVILNQDLSGLGTIDDGRQVTYAIDLATGDATAFFFAEHASNTGNAGLFVCAEQVGLSGADLLATTVNAAVFTTDFYFGGPGDAVFGLALTPLGERYFAVTGDIPGNTDGGVDVIDFTSFPGNSPEAGVMLITNGDRGPGNHGGAAQNSEAVLLLGPGVTPPAPLPD